jgi:hypothetical protein
MFRRSFQAASLRADTNASRRETFQHQGCIYVHSVAVIMGNAASEYGLLSAALLFPRVSLLHGAAKICEAALSYPAELMVTQVKLVLALVVGLIGVALAMVFTASFRNPGTIITALQPGVAMEFAQGSPEADRLLGLASTPDGQHNRTVMRHQQYLDFVLIPLYVAVVALVARHARPRWLGATVVIAIVVAGIFDYFEDFAILAACRGDAGQVYWPISFGVPKWMFYFAATGMVAWPLILSGSAIFLRNSMFSRVLRWSAAMLFAVGAVAGMIGTIVLRFSRQGELLNYAAYGSSVAYLAIAVLLILEVLQTEHPVQKIVQPARGANP